MWQRSYGNRRHGVGRFSSVDSIVSIHSPPLRVFQMNRQPCHCWLPAGSQVCMTCTPEETIHNGKDLFVLAHSSWAPSITVG